ncbi:adenylyl-sulfate kinase [Legionella taurinensis]|uniref:Adenylyl-sulfate kinase n=1 Tax=Legionella taurinensis TaxID=70611 RepID=A0A3A5LG16_9GAMM|nr:adenylyl-sulfate kinase [Legionella taurinensis]MDX1838009.1 adenylyl-sulfate kinase [Legionella taurinensis]PUT39403.1 adenylyl-sulfate kinase [Legionella taurinensis]PUT41712.1 adenylyl-sulfate kinase [Legionella taurinensis]PUT44546.1 adenylyl-sulfate kinase [Legionella taurinensis]PUT46790.1 adenylyl-sulfate kinase [Legionella taurinensis]
MALIWITGFSGAGKTTVAKILQEKMTAAGSHAVLLDGDELRKALGYTQQYSRDERKQIAFKYAHLASLIAKQGIDVIVATISMFEEVRTWNRQNNASYFEVYIKVSEQERRARDPKKLYASGQDLVSEQSLYEEPQNPDVTFDEERKLSPEDMATIIQQSIFEL